MESLKAKLYSDLKEALRSGQENRVSVLRMTQSAIINKEKEKRARIAKDHPALTSLGLEQESQLTDEELLEVLAHEAKKRKESIEGFKKGERYDLVDKETRELEILQSYLPKQFSEEDLRRLVKEAVTKLGALNLKDMGKVMAYLAPQVKGRADGSVLSAIVKEFLGS